MLFHLPKLPAEIRVSHLNARVNEQRKKIAQTTASRLELLQLAQQLAKEAKIRRKNNQKIFVLDFKGDIQASAVENLREEITLILATAKAGRDRIVVRLESPGGMVHGYGLAAAQLVRLRDAGFHLTICVDKVAASGGYMMACIANEIIAAPFAIVGSIGVVAQVPNFNRFKGVVAQLKQTFFKVSDFEFRNTRIRVFFKSIVILSSERLFYLWCAINWKGCFVLMIKGANVV